MYPIQSKFFSFLSVALFSLLLGCRYPIAKQEVLETDNQFLVDENLPNCNQKSLEMVRKAMLDEAESSWDLCVYENPNSVPVHLNRLRFFYILDEYSAIKSKIQKESPSKTSLTYQNLLVELENQMRYEERVIVLDALSQVKGWEIIAFEQLGEYYLLTGNLNYAESYFQSVLELQSFQEVSLFGMAEIQMQRGNWNSLLDYAKSIEVAAKKNRSFHFYFVKAFYELGRYEEAVPYITKASEEEKSQIAFLEVWRDVLLVTNDQPDWEPLLPYYRKAKSKGYAVSESVFFPTLTSSGKEFRKLIRRGRN